MLPKPGTMISPVVESWDLLNKLKIEEDVGTHRSVFVLP